tara:strand:+ start:3886 stop:5067 length:1182 start_codon:yes stop_codon:yes gene_type:complete
MKKNNSLCVIDFGSSMLRMGVFDKSYNRLHHSSKIILEENNYEEYLQSVNLLVREAEKKISNHLESVFVLCDDSEILSVDLSIKKNFDQNVLIKDVYYSMIEECNQLINNNYINRKIIHRIITRYIIDEKEIIESSKIDLTGKSIIIEIKYICFPTKKFNKIKNVFKKNNLEITNFFCSSYVKSFSYINSLNDYDYITFVDIGWEKSTLTSFHKKKIICINSIPVGGNHFTKDISKIFKINFQESENIKKIFNKSELEFSYDQDINSKNEKFLKEIISKNISVDLLKKVILSRIEEIIELLFKNFYCLDKVKKFSNSILVLTGNGSKLLDKNTFYMNDEYKFKEIIFYEEKDLEICLTGLKFSVNSDESDFLISQKNHKKTGIFERFFNFFGR